MPHFRSDMNVEISSTKEEDIPSIASLSTAIQIAYFVPPNYQMESGSKSVLLSSNFLKKRKN